MAAFSLQLSTQQHVSSVFIAALFFGLYLASLLPCLRWLIWADEGWKLRKNIHWTILGIALFIFACSTANVGIVLNSLILEIPHPKVDPKLVPNTGSPGHTWATITECTIANVVALAADAVLIWRCWIIYTCSFLVVTFPLLMWIAGLICTILQLYWQITEAQGLDTAWQPTNSFIGPGTVLTPFWGSTILLNLFATVAITRRLMQIVKEVEGGPSTYSLRFVSRAFAEAGVLYLVITLVHFLVWFTPSVFAIAVVSDINVPITGIAYNLIIIRTSQERAKEYEKFRARKNFTTSIKFADIEAQSHPTVGSQGILESRDTENTDRTKENTIAIYSPN